MTFKDDDLATLKMRPYRKRVASVLIIEDNCTLTATLEGLLADEGYATRSAHSMEVARLRLADERPDVAVLDLTLTDGFADSLLADLVAAKIPTIIVSTFPHASSFAERHGVDLVKKPFELDSLLNAIQRARAQA